MATKVDESLRGFLSISMVLASLIFPVVSHAHSAVGWIDGLSVHYYVATDYASQKEADVAALEGCRTRARDIGLASEASKCTVGHRQKAAGGGAIVCGKDGCSVASGYATKQEAVDEAYQGCVRVKYTECPKHNIAGWLDETGYPKQK